MDWMAWTWPTAAFFGVIALLLITFTILALKYFQTPRASILQIKKSKSGAIGCIFLKAAFILMLFFPTGLLAFDDAAIVERCDTKWGSDFSMVKYCREKQRGAGQALDQFKAQSEGNETAKTVIAHCENKWRKDYSMLIYCVEKQASAIESLATASDAIPSNVQNTIKGECAAKWGTDFSMVAYCVEKQTNAWKEIQ